jgi:hypothetical protein
MLHDLFERASSQMAYKATMKTEMNKRWPDYSRVGNQAVKGRGLQRRGVKFRVMKGMRD